MSEAASRSATRFMREEAKPALPAPLDEALNAAVAASPALKDARAAAAAALRKTGLPHTGTEEFSFLRVSEFSAYLQTPSADSAGEMPTPERVQALLFPESRASYLVLVDGVFAPGLSHPGPHFQVSPLEEALNPSSRAPLLPELRDALVRAAAHESDAPAALAILFAAQPVLVQTAAKTASDAPLQILHFHRPGQAVASTAAVASAAAVVSVEAARRDSWLVFLATRLSESRVIVRHVDIADAATAPGLPAMSNGATHVFVEEGASVKWLESRDGDQNLNFNKLAARVDRDARFSVTSAGTGSKLTRNAFAVDLAAPGAEADIAGAAVIGDSRQNHNHVTLRHLAPNCNSRQHFKTVAAAKSRSSVDGGIYVAEGAQQTNAYQLINNLMLSDEARADSKPRLMIHADDVKCSHGATIGKLDDAQQFYLESRGLPAAQARALLTIAFIGEVAQKSAAVSEGFHQHLERTLVDALRKQAGA